MNVLLIRLIILIQFIAMTLDWWDGDLSYFSMFYIATIGISGYVSVRLSGVSEK